MDDFFASKEKKHNKSYGKGVKDAQNTGAAGHFVHDMTDVLLNVIPHPKNTTAQSYEAGWHSEKGQKRSKPKRDKSYSSTPSYSSSNNSSGAGGLIALCVIVFLVGGLIWLILNEVELQNWRAQQRQAASEQAPIQEHVRKDKKSSRATTREKSDTAHSRAISPQREVSPEVRQKCQELINRSFQELAVDIPHECDEQLHERYKQLQENMNRK